MGVGVRMGLGACHTHTHTHTHTHNTHTQRTHRCGDNETTIEAASTTEAACVCTPGFWRQREQEPAHRHNASLTPPARTAPSPPRPCQACPAGKFKDAAGDKECTACAAGSAQGRGGATSCELCAQGHLMPSTGATACVRCPAAEQMSAAGSTSVLDCECGAGCEGPPGACYCQVMGGCCRLIMR